MASPLQQQKQQQQQPQQQQNDPKPATSPSVHTKHTSSPIDAKSPPDPTMTMHHDSMVTVRLSEPSPTVKTSFGADSVPPPGKSLLAFDQSPRDYVPKDTMAEWVPEEEEEEYDEDELGLVGQVGQDEEDGNTTIGDQDIRQRNLQDELEETGVRNDDIEEEEEEEQDGRMQRERRIQRDLVMEEEKPQQGMQFVAEQQLVSTYEEESDPEEVNWDQLQQTEAKQSQDPEADNSTTMLLARLEQENNKLAGNPKSANMQPPQLKQLLSTTKPRPPSMAQLRQMVRGPTPQALRYSMLPPPPMTDLEFYAALVKDYEQTVARLPTLVANKIRKGIPPPLRGVVWQSMSLARDAGLGDLYDRMCGETSPFETSIGKDLGRTFPGVEMFRDPKGDGQRMLGWVLKCFSLYDPKIGYCQGLAFIVGPLLMHMPDKQAFCVLVRLMETYDIRNCFLPELPGLHVRIYQFSELLRQNLPTLSKHLQDLRVEPIYVSQWFLSFFAVTCPLPMLFRIYDVVFAEGASETMMRVALSLMRKNQARILACSEFGDVMQLLLSRGLWDCYHYNADELVDDFCELSNVVTGETLRALEDRYQQQSETANKQATSNAAHPPSDVATAASRFLGRLWATTNGGSSPKPAATAPSLPAVTAPATLINTATSSAIPNNSSLTPGLTAPPRPLSMIKRSASKQSLASTLNSMEVSSASVVSTASTDATSLSRDSSNTDDSSTIDAPTRPTTSKSPSSSTTTAIAPSAPANTTNSETKYLNSQIEDLLTVLSDLQRTQALLTAELQQEREERDEDRKVVVPLIGGLRAASLTDNKPAQAPLSEQLIQLVGAVVQRFGLEEQVQPSRRSSLGPAQTKSELRDDLQRTKERLATEEARGQESKRRLLDLETDVTTLKDQLRESRDHARVLHADKQRLEKQMHAMRVRPSASTNAPDAPSVLDDMDNRQSAGSGGPASGLREFKLGRSKSTPLQAAQLTRRTSSMPRGGDTASITATSVSAPANEHEALLMELVQAKTGEAIARQEAEEARAKLDQVRRQFGLSSHGDGAAQVQVQATASAAASAAMGVFGRLTGSTQAAEAPKPAPATRAPATTAANSGAGGFWGWKR